MGVEIRREAVAACVLCGSTPSHPDVHEVRVRVIGAEPEVQNFVIDACDACNLAWQNPMPQAGSVAEYYASSAISSGSASALGASGGKQQESRLRYRLSFFRDVSKLANPGSIFDFGAGNILALSTIRDEVFRGRPSLCAVDTSPSSLATLSDSGVECWSSLGAVPESRTFGLVLAFSVLEHVADPKSTLTELSERLEGGGELWLVVPDSRQARLSIGEFFGFEHLWHFTAESLSQMLRELGLFGIVQCLEDGSIVAIARRESLPSDQRDFSLQRDGVSLSTIFERYRERRQELRERVATRVKRFVQKAISDTTQSQSFIWGVGQHTDQLFDVYPDLANASGFIDSGVRPGEVCSYRDAPLFAPADAPWPSITCVLVSSEAYLYDIHSDCKGFARSDCEIILLYDREDLVLPPGFAPH